METTSFKNISKKNKFKNNVLSYIEMDNTICDISDMVSEDHGTIYGLSANKILNEHKLLKIILHKYIHEPLRFQDISYYIDNKPFSIKYYTR